MKYFPYRTVVNTIPRLFLVTVCVVIIGEILDVWVLDIVRPVSLWSITLLHALLFSSVFFPILYYLYFRPLKALNMERKQWETEIQDAREYAENIVETVRIPLMVLDPTLMVPFGQPQLLQYIQGHARGYSRKIYLRSRQQAMEHPQTARAPRRDPPSRNSDQ